MSNKCGLPGKDVDGRTPTLNNMGAMTATIDQIAREFLNYLKQPHQQNYQVLEIGASYGAVALEAIKLDNIHYIANDLDLRHLEILECLAKSEEIENLEQKLELKPGKFPEQTDFAGNSFDAILVERVLHFFSPEKNDCCYK
jgi:ubiquinone/menaquinone biosynthesis C-methylase UbiE